MNIELLEEFKAGHKKHMDMYAENIRDHIDKYGPNPCDYLIHRWKMESYHRGAWNALNQLDVSDRLAEGRK